MINLEKVRTFVVAMAALGFSVSAPAALITFDAVVIGETTFGFDGDADSINDVIFSTTDPFGFNVIGPGPNMTHINEPGLEGTSLLNPDLRVDFLVGATTSLSFGFALDSFTEDDFASFELYDSSDSLLASVTQIGLYTQPDGTNLSSFPEGVISVAFGGLATYGLFNFTSDFGRYIIDNMDGTFGSTELPPLPPIGSLPEPGTLSLLSFGLLSIVWSRRRIKK